MEKQRKKKDVGAHNRKKNENGQKSGGNNSSELVTALACRVRRITVLLVTPCCFWMGKNPFFFVDSESKSSPRTRLVPVTLRTATATSVLKSVSSLNEGFRVATVHCFRFG